MKLGAFKTVDEAVSAFEKVIAKAQWGKKWVPEESPSTSLDFVAGRTGEWFNISVSAQPKSDGSTVYTGTAEHESGLVVRLPSATVERAVKAAKHLLFR
jgi:hypothetical protein